MDIGKDLQRAYDEGYAKGWAEAEAYTLHCGDEKPTTNADRIRAMTDEELAEWLCDISSDSCEYCVATDLCYNGHIGMIDWLKEEAKDG